MYRLTLDTKELDRLPVGSVVIGTEPYSSDKCQNSNFVEIDAGTAWQLGKGGLWYPIANMSVWIGSGKLSTTKPFCVYNPNER